MKIRDASGWTMFIFGFLAFSLGLAGLIRPEIVLSILGFDVLGFAQRAAGDYTLVFMAAASMASFNMGIYYMLAALNDIRIFYTWTVPFRILTFIVFTTITIMGIAPARFIGVGVWELLGALATGVALFLDKKRKPEKVRPGKVKKKGNRKPA